MRDSGSDLDGLWSRWDGCGVGGEAFVLRFASAFGKPTARRVGSNALHSSSPNISRALVKCSPAGAIFRRKSAENRGNPEATF